MNMRKKKRKSCLFYKTINEKIIKAAGDAFTSMGIEMGPILDLYIFEHYEDRQKMEDRDGIKTVITLEILTPRTHND